MAVVAAGEGDIKGECCNFGFITVENTVGIDICVRGLVLVTCWVRMGILLNWW